MESRIRSRGKMISAMIGTTLLIHTLGLANLTGDYIGIRCKMPEWNIFAAADDAIPGTLPTKLSDPSLRSFHIKGQEKLIAPFDLTNRDLAKKANRKKRIVKKRGANKKRANKKRTNAKRKRTNVRKKNARQNGERGKKRTQRRRGGKNRKRNGARRKSGDSNSALKISGRGKKQSNSFNKQKTSKKKGKSNKAKTSKNGKLIYFPKFEMTMCATGLPATYLDPMYSSYSRQECCRKHFPGLVTECMMRSPSGGSGAVVVGFGGNSGAGWGESAWMGGVEPSWIGTGGKPGNDNLFWGGTTWMSGKSSKGEKAGKATTVLYVAVPGAPKHPPTYVPTSMPTTYIPTYYPTSLPTQQELIQNTAIPTYSPTSPSPTMFPTLNPTAGTSSMVPTMSPTPEPNTASSSMPTMQPSIQEANPTIQPTMAPTEKEALPTMMPTVVSTMRTEMPTVECSNTRWLFWGAEDGIGGNIADNQPVPDLKDEPVLDVSAGSRYTLLVDSEGNAYASGFIESKFEYLGHFGVESSKLQEGPNEWHQIDKVAGLSGKETTAPPFAKVYAGASATANSGEQHSLFIDQDGNVYTSGNNDRGQLCLGDTDPRYIPNQVSLKGPAIAAAIGEDFSLILLDDGSVYGCGSNEKGELGMGNSVKSVDAPNNDNGLSNIVDVSAGLNHALFLSGNGNVFATGSNIYMQMCEFSDGEPVTTPKAIKNIQDVKADVEMIMAGRESSYFLLSNGEVKACGRNDEGQLGDGTFVDNEFVTVVIPTGEAISNVGSGPSSQSAFFFGENSVFGAGANDRFQLGLGEIGSKTFPVEVEFNELDTVAGILKISSSGTQTVAYNCPVAASDSPTFSPTVDILSTLPTFSPSASPTEEGNITQSSIPTFSPTATPTTGVMSAIPTFSPTATPTLGGSVPTFSPTSTPTVGGISNVTATPTAGASGAVPTFTPTYVTTAVLASPTNSPTYNTTAVLASPTNSPTYFTTEAVPTNSPTYLVNGTVDSPTFIPTQTPSSLGEGLPTASPTYLATLTATALYFSGDPKAVGENTDGNLLVPTDANEIILDGSSGSRYTLLILSDGSAAAAGIIDSASSYQGHFGVSDWVEGLNELQVITNFTGLDGVALTTPPVMEQVFASVETVEDSGLLHSLFIDTNGNVYASGNNDKGQLCLGDTQSRESPYQIDLPSPAVSAAVGGDFTLILTADGKVYGCGSNEAGQLGLGPSVDSALLPDDGNDLSGVQSVSAGLNFAVFKTTDGLFVTGDNSNGQLCVDSGTTPVIDTPSLLSDVDGASVKRFEAGYQSSYLLFKQDGSVAACGLNDVGQLGDGTTDSKARTAVIIPGDDPIINLGLGPSASSAFFLSKDAVYSTGANEVGQLGINDQVASVSSPTEVFFTESLQLYNISPGSTQTLYW